MQSNAAVFALSGTQCYAVGSNAAVVLSRHRWLTAGSAAEGRNPSMSGLTCNYLPVGSHPRPAWTGIESSKGSHADARTLCTAPRTLSNITRLARTMASHAYQVPTGWRCHVQDAERKQAPIFLLVVMQGSWMPLPKYEQPLVMSKVRTLLSGDLGVIRSPLPETPGLARHCREVRSLFQIDLPRLHNP